MSRMTYEDFVRLETYVSLSPRDPERIAYSPEHDGYCDVERVATFHEAAGEACPAFTRYRLSWTDALGCRHLVRYDLELQSEGRAASVK
jgi:hypothetical protein